MLSFGDFVLLSMLFFMLWHAVALRKDLSNKTKLVRGLKADKESLQRKLQTRAYSLDDLLAAIQSPIVRVDRAGRVMSANQAARQLFGIRDVSVLPQSMVVLYRNPDWLQSFTEAAKRLPEVVELPEIVIGESVYLPHLAGLGQEQGLLLCLDVTEQYRLQQQRKGFVSNLMHDLKTPLTSLLGYARSIEAFDDDVALRQEALGVIAREALHVNSLLDALLSVEQVEHGQTGQGSCDVVAVCKQVWQALQPDMDAKGLELSMQMPETFEIAMHESDCMRVVMNVASNAVHYSLEDGVLYCSLQDDVLQIEDEGLGIPEKDLPHVIERFYRVDEARSGTGHGLGLAIVHETLQRDGGELFIDNRDEGGLCVQMTLPV